jgi:hypothetical protein
MALVDIGIQGRLPMALSGWQRPSCITSVAWMLVLSAGLQGCGSPPRTPQASGPSPTPISTPPVEVDASQATPASPSVHVSAARDPAEYRRHAAQHLYEQHAARLFNGPMPPLLQAVGVLNVDIGAQGEVRSLTWLRPPSHVPEVMRQIEQLIHHAAPYPAPTHLGRVTYTDTWLWHHSGRFQLHTLSEGQLGEVQGTVAKEPKRRVTRRTTPTQTSVMTAKCSQPTAAAGTYC